MRESVLDPEVGKAYFEVVWASPRSIVPSINSYIYIGCDIFGGSKGEHFFQTAYSYETHGDFSQLKDQALKAQADVVMMQSSMVDVLYTIDGLIKYLGDVREKHGDLFGIKKHS